MVEDILQAQQIVGHQGDCGGIWASLVLAALQNSLGDPLPIFRASFQLHGHSGGLVDNFEGVYGGLLVGAVPFQGDGDSIGCGVDGYCALAGVFQTSVQPNQDQNLQDFKASSTPLGQSGSQVRDGAVGWCWVEDTAGALSLFRGVGNCGVGARG